MAKTTSRKRIKPKDGGRKIKKKISPLVSEAVDYIDYKDVDLLRRFMSDRAKIRSRRVSGNDSQQQREIARAIKNAREMGLLPYTSRVTTQRRSGNRGRDDRGGDEGGRRERSSESRDGSRGDSNRGDSNRGDSNRSDKSPADDAPAVEQETKVDA